MKQFDCLIIGAGPCGMGAAIALKKEGINFAIINEGPIGGKVNVAPRVDNYPGFTKIPGPDLAFEFYKRLKANDINVIGDSVTSLTKEGDLFNVTCEHETYFAKTVLIASGTKERKLGLAKEEELFAKGISYCAICDGHFFKGEDVAIIGGGNSALKEAIYLAPMVNHLYLLHRRNEFRGLDKLVDELREMNNVTIFTPYIPLEILGEDKVTGLVIQNKETEVKLTLNVQGIFPLVGQIPNTTFIKINNVVNEWGTIPVERNMETSCHNLFAGGDVLPRDIRQIYLSEHDGMVAAKTIIERLK